MLLGEKTDRSSGLFRFAGLDFGSRRCNDSRLQESLCDPRVNEELSHVVRDQRKNRDAQIESERESNHHVF